MFTQDIQSIFYWWIMFFVLGMVSIPTCHVIFSKFTDIGYGFAKTIGLLIVGFTVFLLAIFHILPVNLVSVWAFFVLWAILNTFLFFRRKKEVILLFRKNIRVIAFQEILYIFGLTLWSWVRAHNPDINGLEKFMDYGFINSALKSGYLPPSDMWFAGETINYYWFGHYITAVATILTRIPSYITYNLMLAHILGASLTSVFSLVSTLVKSVGKIDKRKAYAAGIIAAFAVNFAGNFHTPLYVLKDGRDKYWYPDATRFIGYNPDTNDKTIHEFPIYSYVVSDLHAHLINLPLVLLFLSLLYISVSTTGPGRKKKHNLRLFMLPGFLLGIMFTTSAWDFGNYALASGFVILVYHIRKTKLSFDTFWNTGVAMTVILATGVVTFIPFMLKFQSIAQGVAFVHAHSPLWQLAILWGFPAVFTTVFSLYAYKHWKSLKTADLFVIGLLISSWALITLPEIIYVKDIYISSHHRANTMFKLTYQAYVMSYLSSGYIAIRVLDWFEDKRKSFLLALFFFFVYASVFYYPKIAVDSYYGDLKTYRGLNGETWLRDIHPDLYATIAWFRKNVEDQPVILEAPGDSYTEYNVVSAYTGLPTVSGWFVHEWLWRGKADFPQARVSDITEIYTSPDLQTTKFYLDKYNVKYVIVGNFERQKFPNLIDEKFGQIGTMVFASGTTKVYKVND